MYNRITEHIDWGILTLVVMIVSIGLLALYSSTSMTNIQIFYKQLIWVGLGFTVMFLAFAFDYRNLMVLAWPLYGLVLFLLVLVLMIAPEIGGSRRWLSLGPIGGQPSELAKIMVIIWVAYWGSKKRHIQDHTFRDLLPALAIVALPVLLIFWEPDLGTSGIVGIIAVLMLVLLGIRRSTLLGAGAVVLAAIPIAWFFVLKSYQRLRVLSFLDPSRDPLGSGYHAMQSKIAVGSGGLFGKGLMHGTQTQLRFLPECHTDFIFSVIAEEWGFVGSALLIFLYLVLITRIIGVGLKAKDRFGSMICFGIGVYLTLHVFINIAMVIGAFPVVGVPLPFVSYGGSFMLINMACIGVVLSIDWRKYAF